MSLPTNKTLIACVCAMLVCEFSSPMLACANVPEEFVALVHGAEERIEIRHFGRALGLYRVHVSPSAVRIEEPERLMRALDGIAEVEQYGDAIEEALSTTMPRNGNLVCASQSSGCSHIETQSAAVIFDESNGVLNLFLSPTWLKAQAQDSRFHEISASTESALIHNQIVNVSAGKHYRSLSVSGSAALGISEKSFVGGNWDFSHTGYLYGARNEFRLRDLYYRRDWGAKHYSQVGRMDSRNLASRLGGNFGFSMLPTSTIDGVRVGTTLAYVNAKAAAQGVPVTVLLSRDARVDAYRGNELLGSFYLRSGINTLDTSYFPEGAYLVTLRIFEDGVQVRTQSTPFSKRGGVGDDTVQWFAQAGRPVESFNATGAALEAAAGVRVPLPGAVSLTSGVATQRSKLFSETSATWSHTFPVGVLSLSGAFFFGTDGTRGNTQSLSFSRGASWSVYRYQVRSGQPRGNAAYRTVGSYDTITASVSMPLGNWSAMFGYTFNKSVGRAYNPDPINDQPWYVQSRRTSESRISRAMQLAISRSDTWRGVNFSSRVGAFVRNDAARGGDRGFYVGLSMSRAKTASAPGDASSYTSGGTDVRSSRGQSDVNYNASQNWAWDGNTYREVGVDVSGTGTSSTSARLSGRSSGSKYGNVTAAVSNSFLREHGSAPSVTGSYVSSMAVGSQGLVWGGAGSQSEPMAGVMVGVAPSDEARGAAAEVDLPGLRQGNVSYGERRFAPVPAFSPLSFEVRDATALEAQSAASSVVEGLGRRELFMIPGRMLTHNVESKSVYTYVGQALSPDGFPLSDSVILNAPTPPLDEAGGFVAEFDRKETEMYLADGRDVLRCPLAVKDQRDVLMLVGAVQCEITDLQDLPDEISKQARVKRVLERRYVLTEPGTKIN